MFSMFPAFIDRENWVGTNSLLSFLFYTMSGNMGLHEYTVLEFPSPLG